MAKPKKLESGSWFIQFMCKGVRKSGTFATSAEAKAWQVHETADATFAEITVNAVRNTRNADERH